jgi:LIVCS family branched-chain amino acid:cation transporter
MNKKINDYFVIGFALFAMFFGAGNLIFPPSLGKLVGDNYLVSIIGFLITGVGLPLLGILSCIKSGGNFENIAGKVGYIFSMVITTALILAIGPMVAIPRTAATTFELSVLPLIPSISPAIAIILYFIINLIFVLKPSSIIDNIGKFLTPVLLIMLFTIIIKGIISPIGSIIDTGYINAFSNSLLEGYQTMDAMASVIFASIIISSVKMKGYKNNVDIIKVTTYSSLVAVIGLSLVYGGLLYLGSQTSTLFDDSITRTMLIMDISRSVLGSFGAVALAISVGLACLTTSIGLTATGAEFFTRLSKGKLSYKFNVLMITIVSMIISFKGVDLIVSIAAPILQIIYPVIIVLIITNFLENFIKNNRIIAITTYVTLVVSVLNTINSLTNNSLKSIFNIIPLSSLGFSWVIPCIIAFVISFIFLNNKSDLV